MLSLLSREETMSQEYIEIRGARENIFKNVSLTGQYMR
jgi:hypothetical protein